MDAGAHSDPVKNLAKVLSHSDPTQLFFQLTEIAGERTYLRHGVELAAGDVVLDVGANVGVAAAFFALECGAGRVHCFEPVGPVCELLRANVGDIEACVVHEIGLSSAPGQVPITYYPGSAAMSGLYADPERDRALTKSALINLGFSPDEAEERLQGRYEAQTLTCELRTLSSVLRTEEISRVDLLKVDVERAELDVLNGIEDGDWPKLRQVVMEVHDERGRCAEIERRLTERGFDATVDQDPAMRRTGVHMIYARRR